MKTKILFILFLFFSFSFEALADGFYFFRHSTYRVDRHYCSDCQCTDLGRYRNPCISDLRYCQAFGNIGAR